jgi:hypothetical protein
MIGAAAKVERAPAAAGIVGTACAASAAVGVAATGSDDGVGQRRAGSA